MIEANTILTVVDIVGTASFAFSGALRVLDRKPDIIGMFILASCTALGGGILRDTIINREQGAVALLNPWYPIVIILSVLITCRFPVSLLKNAKLFLYFDAIGFGTLATITANLTYENYSYFAVIIIASFAACAGGVVRDLIIQKPTVVLSNEIVITPVLFGVSALVLARNFGATEMVGFLLAFSITCGMRVLAITYDWRLPHVFSIPTSEKPS